MSDPRARAEQPPTTLADAGRALWNQLTGDFDFPDAGSRELLLRACFAADRIEEARASLARNGGPIVLDRFGKPQRHPAVLIERDATSTLLSCLKHLGLKEASEQREPKPKRPRPR